MKRQILNFISRVKRLLEWVPVIWHTHDWDYAYALDIFKEQLERTANYLENGHLENGSYNADRIRLALRLMDAGYNARYSEKVHLEYEEKYGRSEIIEKPADDLDKDLIGIEIWWPAAKNSMENEDIHQELSHDLMIAYDKEKRARDLFHQILKNDIQKWWD